MSMRVRSYAIAALFFVFASSLEAQTNRPFENAWFWGLKAGTVRVATNEESRTVGSIGADWVITRKTGGLYVSYDMSNFVSRARISDSNAGGGFRQIEVNDLRRVGVAGMIFPVKYGRVRPYAGIGMSLDLLGDAAVVVDSLSSADDAPDQTFLSTVDGRRSQSALLFLGGAQMELSRMAAFAQISVAPNTGRFLVGRDPMLAVQFGLRYNVGTSIDRAR